ncbi:hypothetical protein BDQ17DRAFT_1233710 [Cyathus striatus]|nr:hypothetical protein BDQ17DRAFT_1233710 [Cyathus striatus]
MSRRNRPSAFDISFPGEAGSSTGRDTYLSNDNPASRSLSVASQASHDSVNTGSKRKNESADPKFLAARYNNRENEKLEDAELVLPGEDPEDGEKDDKPVRVLTDFVIYDPKHRNEMVSLSSLEEDDGVDRQFEGVGFVYPFVQNDEDEGQEEDDDTPILIKLSAIMRYTMDYSNEDEPMYIETMFGWYILQAPSKEYMEFYKHFFAPHKIAQIAISFSLKDPRRSFDEFISHLISQVDPFGRTYEESDIWQAIPEIQAAILESSEGDNISRSALMRHIVRNTPTAPSRNQRSQLPRSRPKPKPISRLGLKPDLAVLKPENQNSTTVTPLIANLSQGWINEELIVVGPQPHKPSQAVLEARVKKARAIMWKFIETVGNPKQRAIDYKKSDKIAPGSNFLKAVEIGGEIYRAGDYIVVRRGKWGNFEEPILPKSLPDIPEHATLPDYFWFAKIIHIKLEEAKAHIQWLEHGKQIILAELANPQELFLNDLCNDIDLRSIIGKVTVHERPKHEIGHDEYFCKFYHNQASSSFTSIDDSLLEKANAMPPPDNCPICLLQSQQRQDMTDQELHDSTGRHGVSFAGKIYHIDDFVLYRSEKGPANIGQIKQINFPIKSNKKATFTLIKVGRISCIPDNVLPEKVVRDERHVYLTDEKLTLELDTLVCVVFAYSASSFQHPETKLSEWLDLSPNHFYVRYKFPSLEVTSWSMKEPVKWRDLPICKFCCTENIAFRKNMIRFHKFMRQERNTLATLDLFGGVGAFSRALAEGSKSLKITHAVEISPSAAKTFKRNSPETVVYNQCANVMLRYAIKSDRRHNLDIPTQIFNDSEQVPLPPKPGDIKAIVAGFPCQSHSRLNMYQKANDRKSNLILNALSWQDFLRPEISYYENVPGFLSFRLKARQINQNKVGGGIEMGGLKFTVRALLDMGYQVRYGLLQAGHYGTPQRRLRFFIITALDGRPLPELPQPSHQFPDTKGLSMYLPTGKISPIRITDGTAPHHFVSIHDAISDLPRFHWKNPARIFERDVDDGSIPSFECSKNVSFCGFKGAVGYHHPPKTSYQVGARQVATTDLQHYTKCLIPKKVERVVAIPLKAGANFRNLPAHLQEWQLVNQLSAVGRKGYTKTIWSTRQEGLFSNTVTNMDPTAKQCSVLNPYCRRMVTVRELARSQGFPDNFVFEAVDNNVVTMHRQIGNAVPLPLGRALGRELGLALFKKWREATENAIENDSDQDDAAGDDVMDIDSESDLNDSEDSDN